MGNEHEGVVNFGDIAKKTCFENGCLVYDLSLSRGCIFQIANITTGLLT